MPLASKRRKRPKWCDAFATLTAARSNPESLLENAAILDEVQRCPELLIALKKSVDEQRRPGRFILSGSANLALLGHVTETLAGRAGYFALHPMTRREQRGATAQEPFLVKFLSSPTVPTGKADPVTEREVLRGGLPPACLGMEDGVEEWFRGYVQTYVERDVRQLSQITDLAAFRSLAQLAALRTAQVLVISTLARDAKLNAVTAGRPTCLLARARAARSGLRDRGGPQGLRHRGESGHPLERGRSVRPAGVFGADARLRRRRAGVQREGGRETGRPSVCHPAGATAGVRRRLLTRNLHPGRGIDLRANGAVGLAFVADFDGA